MSSAMILKRLKERNSGNRGAPPREGQSAVSESHVSVGIEVCGEM